MELKHTQAITKELMELLKEPYLLSSFFIQIHSERHIEQLQERSVTGFGGKDPNKLPTTADSNSKLLKTIEIYVILYFINSISGNYIGPLFTYFFQNVYLKAV